MRLDDRSVSQFHALLQVVEGVPYCVDLGSRTGLAWDDTPRSCGWVTRDQVLRVGLFDVQVVNPVADAPPACFTARDTETGVSTDHPQAAVEIYPSNGGVGAVVPLDQPVMMLGRHPNCRLRLIDDEIGYFHGYLVNIPGEVWWVELTGRQGSRLNGRPAGLARLKDGDLIEVGRMALVFRAGGEGDRPVGDGQRVGTVLAQTGGRHYPLASEGHGQLAPVRDMMEQFQRCLTTMAGMFTAMQQEHVTLMCEQMRQVQELAKELRDLRGEIQGKLPANADHNAPIPLVTAVPPPPPAPRPTPQVAAEGDQAALTDAHAWFLGQLAKFDQSSAPPKAQSSS